MKYKLQGATRSLTVKVNLVFMAIVASLPELIPFLIEHAPMLQPYLGPETYRYVMGAITISNIILRFRTRVPLEAK